MAFASLVDNFCECRYVGSTPERIGFFKVDENGEFLERFLDESFALLRHVEHFIFYVREFVHEFAEVVSVECEELAVDATSHAELPQTLIEDFDFAEVRSCKE